jgi:S1/P1 Nuclease
MRRLSILLISMGLLSRPGFPWWGTGHQTVARIAASHLTPAARTRVARILGVPDTLESVAESLARCSTWADDTKAETKTGDWHFIDLTLQDTRADIPSRCAEQNCAPARIRLFATQLSSQAADSKWSELDALRYLVHLVGDIHQPLHAISDADLGGNCERLDPPFNQAKNLHALWDGEIVNEILPNDQALAADLEKGIQALGGEQLKALAQGTQDDWTWESHELAMKNIYYKLHVPLERPIFPKNCDEAPAEITAFKPQIDRLYVDTMKPLVREQLTKAGLRLARLLNESL